MYVTDAGEIHSRAWIPISCQNLKKKYFSYDFKIKNAYLELEYFCLNCDAQNTNPFYFLIVIEIKLTSFEVEKRRNML